MFHKLQKHSQRKKTLHKRQDISGKQLFKKGSAGGDPQWSVAELGLGLCGLVQEPSCWEIAVREAGVVLLVARRGHGSDSGDPQ